MAEWAKVDFSYTIQLKACSLFDRGDKAFVILEGPEQLKEECLHVLPINAKWSADRLLSYVLDKKGFKSYEQLIAAEMAQASFAKGAQEFKLVVKHEFPPNDIKHEAGGKSRPVVRAMFGMDVQLAPKANA